MAVVKKRGVVAVVLGIVFLGVATQAERLLLLALQPHHPFREESPPPPPDYGDDRYWAALPERQDAADEFPEGSPPSSAPEADVFYLHPTAYVGGQWNGSLLDPALNRETDRIGVQMQASAFNGCCAVYAPRYRQGNATLFLEVTEDGEAALDLAWQDVHAAFQEFERRRKPGRPWILAAHSQGSVLAERLLQEEVTGTVRRDLLVAAWLLGASLTPAGLAEKMPDLLPCRHSLDLHCVIAWNARAPEHSRVPYEMVRPDQRQRLCTNPLSWKVDGQLALPSLQEGAVFLDVDAKVHPHFADAQCKEGVLLVHTLESLPWGWRLISWAMGPGNYHSLDYSLFYMNVRSNAMRRVEQMLGRRTGITPSFPGNRG